MTYALAPMQTTSEVAEEPGALIAVERSARAYVRAFPYLAWRFGEAGYTTIRNDNAHLMAIAENYRGELHAQVGWTADLLAERGVPRWLLECDLQLMARAAKRSLPQRRELHERLTRAAGELRWKRRSLIPERVMQRCAREFADVLGNGRGRVWVGFGAILVAAVIDERGGCPHAVTRMREWATDRRRFDSRWIDAVERTIDHGRNL